MEIISKLNWIDILVIIIFLRTSYVSFHDGLSHQVLPLIGSAVSVVVSLYYYSKIALLMGGHLPAFGLRAMELVAFLAIVFIVGLVFRVIKFVLDKIIKVSWHPAIEKLGGLLTGLVKATVVVSIVLIAISLVPASYMQRSIKDRSLTGMWFLAVGPSIYDKASAVFPGLSAGISGPVGTYLVDSITEEKIPAAPGDTKTLPSGKPK